MDEVQNKSESNSYYPYAPKPINQLVHNANQIYSYDNARKHYYVNIFTGKSKEIDCFGRQKQKFNAYKTGFNNYSERIRYGTIPKMKFDVDQSLYRPQGTKFDGYAQFPSPLVKPFSNKTLTNKEKELLTNELMKSNSALSISKNVKLYNVKNNQGLYFLTGTLDSTCNTKNLMKVVEQVNTEIKKGKDALEKNDFTKYTKGQLKTLNNFRDKILSNNKTKVFGRTLIKPLPEFYTKYNTNFNYLFKLPIELNRMKRNAENKLEENLKKGTYSPNQKNLSHLNSYKEQFSEYGRSVSTNYDENNNYFSRNNLNYAKYNTTNTKNENYKNFYNHSLKNNNNIVTNSNNSNSNSNVNIVFSGNESQSIITNSIAQNQVLQGARNPLKTYNTLNNIKNIKKGKESDSKFDTIMNKLKLHLYQPNYLNLSGQSNNLYNINANEEDNKNASKFASQEIEKDDDNSFSLDNNSKSELNPALVPYGNKSKKFIPNAKAIKSIKAIQRNAFDEQTNLVGYRKLFMKERNFLTHKVNNIKDGSVNYKKDLELLKTVNPINCKIEEENNLKDIIFFKKKHKKNEIKEKNSLGGKTFKAKANSFKELNINTPNSNICPTI